MMAVGHADRLKLIKDVMVLLITSAMLVLALSVLPSIGMAQSNCERLIRSKLFSCRVKTDAAEGVFSECLEFSAKGEQAPDKFDMIDSRAT